ncbi:MAG: hypothetical protein LBU39_07530 [Desulfobulbaceae bacterium]|jgi:rhodanese-related sulfurtransferase|nr:hypothetical protein [Desulfobulbaceae bacterium]
MPLPIVVGLLISLALSGCAGGERVALPSATITARGRILAIIDQPPLLSLAVTEGDKTEARLLRHDQIPEGIYEGGAVVVTVATDCWEKGGGRDGFCLAETVANADEPDNSQLEPTAPEEISAEEFRAALAGTLPKVLILDVRGRDEMAQGVFKNAALMPLDELAAHYRQLPEHKEIFIHCAAGTRAKMAAYELNRLGFKARYLPLDISSPECACPFDIHR